MEEQAGNGTLQFQIRHTMSELCVAMFVAWIRKPCVWVLPVVVSCSLRNVLGWPLAVTIAIAFVNLIWPLLMLSFGPTWPLFRLPSQTQFLDPLP
jgi:hypothetical protein